MAFAKPLERLVDVLIALLQIEFSLVRFVETKSQGCESIVHAGWWSFCKACVAAILVNSLAEIFKSLLLVLPQSKR